MTISVISTVGTDTGQASYAAAGTVTNAASVTTQVGDVVFVFHSYKPPGGVLISCTITGGTGAWTSGPGVLVDFGVWASQAFYRIATAAETFTTVATLASNATERRITVAVLRSTTGGFTFVSGTNLSSYVQSPTFPGTISGPAFATSNNSIVISGFSTGGSNPPSGTAQNGFTAGITSDWDLTLYKTVATASTETPAISSVVTDIRTRFAGFAFAEAITYTYARPSSDVTTQWTPSSGTSHFALIDEVTYNDADYIYATAAAQTDEVGLQAMSTPAAGTDVLVNYRVQGITGGGSVTVSLYSGATLVKTDTTRTADNTSPPYYTMTVTAAEWGAVAVNWSNMRLRFVSA
jgi:hypothetical protein